MRLAVVAGVALGSLAGSAQAASGPTYGLSASYSTFPCGGIDCPLEQPYDWTGTASCIANCTGVPQSGSFSIELTGSGRRYPPNPCITRRVQGTFAASWSDGSFTTAALSGRARDGKAYRIKGITDATSTAYPSDPTRGSLAFPTDPFNPSQRDACLAGTASWLSDPVFVAFGS